MTNGYHIDMRLIFAVWLFSSVVLGQRATCTGTLHDPQGQPISDATVTFCQDPSQALGGEADRVEVETTSKGAFSAGLLPGSAYAVWAVGPADEDGKR